MSAIKFLYRINHCHNIFGRYIGLNVMYSIENKTSVFCKNIAVAKHLFPYLFLSSIGKRFLSINSSTPKSQMLAVCIFQVFWIHPSCTHLNRIDNVEPGINKSPHKVFHCAAGVFKCFPTGIGMHPIVDPPVIRKPEIIKLFGRAEGGILCAKIGATKKNHINVLAGSLVNSVQVFKSKRTLSVKYIPDIFSAQNGAHVPLGNAPDSTWLPELYARYQGDVAKRCTTQTGNYSFASGAGLFSNRFPMEQSSLFYWCEFFHVVIYIQILIINRQLPLDGVEKIACFRHF